MGKSNRFKDAADVEDVVHQAIGAGSMCWENLRGAGTFDDVNAAKVAKEALERLRELGVAT